MHEKSGFGELYKNFSPGERKAHLVSLYEHFPSISIVEWSPSKKALDVVIAAEEGLYRRFNGEYAHGLFSRINNLLGFASITNEYRKLIINFLNGILIVGRDDTTDQALNFLIGIDGNEAGIFDPVSARQIEAREFKNDHKNIDSESGLRIKRWRKQYFKKYGIDPSIDFI